MENSSISARELRMRHEGVRGDGDLSYNPIQAPEGLGCSDPFREYCTNNSACENSVLIREK